MRADSREQFSAWVLMVQADQLSKRLERHRHATNTRGWRIWRKARSRYYRRRAELQQIESDLYPQEDDDG